MGLKGREVDNTHCLVIRRIIKIIVLFSFTVSLRTCVLGNYINRGKYVLAERHNSA